MPLTLVPSESTGLDDLFGTHGRVNFWDFSWTCLKESDAYFRKDLDKLKEEWPPFPSSTTSKRDYDTVAICRMGAIDNSSDQVLSKWIKVALNPIGDPWVAYRKSVFSGSQLFRCRECLFPWGAHEWEVLVLVLL